MDFLVRYEVSLSARCRSVVNVIVSLGMAPVYHQLTNSPCKPLAEPRTGGKARSRPSGSDGWTLIVRVPLHTLPMPPTQQRPRRRKARLLILLIVVVSFAALRFRPKPYDPKPWLEDYQEVRLLMGEKYVNLDWSIARYRLDIRQLHAETYHDLIYARSDKDAGRILRRFVDSFQDPHVSLLAADRPPLGPQPATRPLSRVTSPAEACAALNYRDRAGAFAFSLRPAKNLRRLPGSNSFPAALLEGQAGAAPIGLLRIGSFSERDYRGACLREWPSFRQALAGTCEGACQRNFDLAVSARLLRELSFRIRELRLAGAGAILIDVTDNPGGHPWARTAAKLFTPRPLPVFRASLSKGHHTTESLLHDRQIVFRYLTTHRLAPSDRAALESALCRLDDLIAEIGSLCMAGPVWDGEPWRLGCSRLSTRPYFHGGVLEADPGGRFPFEVAQVIHVESFYPHLPGAWDGPVAVLTDEDTASAAELFAGYLKFGAGALLLGRHTANAGGGWTLGQYGWTLENSGMHLYMPDTAEYWPTGENAREGLEPDLRSPLPPRKNSAFTAAWLARTLPQFVVPPAER
jgi:Peptidase family S41